ncbi:MAG: HAD family hydrolase [Lachnospiraceae bacterium]|nr:HAD family hydrolase [Lachnospiraceae bacterium]
MKKPINYSLPEGIDSIIYDLDGTLWDSVSVVATGWNKAFHSFPQSAYLTVTEDDLRGLFGKTMETIGHILMDGHVPAEEQQEILDACYPAEEEALDANPPAPYEGVEESFRILSEKYRLFIVSNCQAGYIECFLRNTGLGKYITDHTCPGDTGYEKAYNIRHIIEKHNLSSAIYVGDIQGDCNATREAGIPFVHAAYGFGEVEKPDAVIYSPMGLTELLP